MTDPIQQFINTSIGVGLGGVITWLSLKPKQKIDEAAFITKAYHDIYELVAIEKNAYKEEVSKLGNTIIELKDTIEKLKLRIVELERK